jgi:adenylate cyclase, class 2
MMLGVLVCRVSRAIAEPLVILTEVGQAQKSVTGERANGKEKMAKETEIKLPVGDIKAFERKVKKLGGKRVRAGTGRVHELNVIFDTPDGGLAKHGQLLRIRTETAQGTGRQAGSRVVLTFKQPAVRGVDDEGSRFKIREETEVEVIEAGPLRKIFEGLGLRGWFSYEKYRTTWKLGGAQRWAKELLIELDETPAGNFVELEGPPEAIDRAAAALGYSHRDYLQKNYLALYAEDCKRRGITPGDMMFDSGKKK